VVEAGAEAAEAERAGALLVAWVVAVMEEWVMGDGVAVG
jgi:hypothetical protein